MRLSSQSSGRERKRNTTMIRVLMERKLKKKYSDEARKDKKGDVRKEFN